MIRFPDIAGKVESFDAPAFQKNMMQLDQLVI